MKEDIEITRIKLRLDGKIVELTVAQAKKLKNSLDELFGKEIVREVHHHGWHWYYNTPYIYISPNTSSTDYSTPITRTTTLDTTAANCLELTA